MDPLKSVSNKDFQLVVDSKSILNSEGARAVPITSYLVYEGTQQHSSNDATETNNINFGKSVSHRVDEKNEFRVDYVDNNLFQQTNLPLIVDNSSKSQLIVKFILILHSEGEFYLLKSEGAQAAPNHSSQLIVASINSEISFHFCDNCRIFREGVKGATAIPNGLFGRNLAFGIILAFGQNLAFGRTTAFGLIMAFGYITVGCCIALQLHHSPNCLAVADGFSNISLGIIGLIDCIIGRNGLINFVSCTNRNGVIGIVGHWIVGFVGSMVLPWPNGLVGLLTLGGCWIVGGLGDLGLISALWVFRLVVNISLIEPFVNLNRIIGLGFGDISSPISSSTLLVCRLIGFSLISSLASLTLVTLALASSVSSASLAISASMTCRPCGIIGPSASLASLFLASLPHQPQQSLWLIG